MRRLLWAMLLAACEPEPSGTRALFDPSLAPTGVAARDWLAFPFPSDQRRTASGGVDAGAFPMASRSGLLGDWLDALETLDGFSIAAPAYIAFDAPVAAGELPRDAGAFLAPDAPLQIIDVTPGSPEYGRRFPLRWHYFAAGSDYVAADTLVVGPAWGFPLREHTTYAVIVTNALRGADGLPLGTPEILANLLARQSEHAALAAAFAPLVSYLEDRPIDGIAVATVFTTQSITAELARIRDQVLDELPVSAIDPEAWVAYGDYEPKRYWQQRSFAWTTTGTSAVYYVMDGAMSAPGYQVGEKPYLTEGGALASEPVSTERLRVVVSIPRDRPQGGLDCYPIVMVSHGTGGNAETFVDDGTAGRLAGRGLAAIGIDQPLHGQRYTGGGAPELYTFNFLNPDSARATLRQSAIDTFALSRLLREGGLAIPAERSPNGQPICFDTERIGFFGHSQGGLTGAMSAAFTPGVRAWLLSATGGGFARSAVERTDAAFAGIRDTLLASELGLTEPLSEWHPILAVLQTLIDVTDLLGYAPHWEQSLLLTSGHHDEQTPFRTAQALALAGRLAPVEPVVLELAGADLAGLESVPAPVAANARGRTAGFIQWTNDIPGDNADNHFVVYWRPEAIHASMQFLKSALYDGRAVIERDPTASVR
jgi:hypothetical protein